MSALDKGLEKLAERLEGAFQAVGARMSAGLSETTNAVRILAGGRAVPLYGTASQRIVSGRGRVTGWSLRETSGASPAVVRLRAGLDVGADLLFTIALKAGDSSNIGMPATAFGDGLFLEVVSGTVEGSVLLGVVD